MTDPLLRRILLIVCGCYSAYCLVVVTVSRPLELQRDSHRYLLGGVMDARQPGILPTAIMSTLGDSAALPFTQMLLASAAWSLLAVGVFDVVKGRLGFTLGIVVLIYSLATQLMSWQWLALADGLAITVCTAWLGGLLVFIGSRRSSAAFWALLIGPLALVALTRPTLLILVAPVQAVAIIRFSESAATRTRIAGMAALLGAVGWGALRLVMLSSVDEFRRTYAENNLSDKSGYRAWAAPHLDGCVDRLATLERRPIPAACAEASDWLIGTGGSHWRWVVEEPTQVAHQFVSSMMTSRFRAYATQAGPLPFDLSELIVPRSSSVVKVSALFLVLGVAVVAAVGNTVRPDRRTLGLVAVAALGAVGYLAVVWLSDGTEHERHMMPVTVMAPLVLLLAPTLSTVRRTGRRPGPLLRWFGSLRRQPGTRPDDDPVAGDAAIGDAAMDR